MIDVIISLIEVTVFSSMPDSTETSLTIVFPVLSTEFTFLVGLIILFIAVTRNETWIKFDLALTLLKSIDFSSSKFFNFFICDEQEV